MAKASVPKAVLLDGAQMALAGMCAGMMGFLKERQIPAREMIAYIGEMFEGSLGDLEGEPVTDVMEHLLTLQILPMGAEIISSQGTADRAEVRLTSLPSRSLMEKFGTTPEELLEGFNITADEFASLYAMYEPAAEAIGLVFKHRLQDGEEVISLERRP